MAMLIIREFLLTSFLAMIQCILTALDYQFIKGNFFFMCKGYHPVVQFFCKADGFGDVSFCMWFLYYKHGIHL